MKYRPIQSRFGTLNDTDSLKNMTNIAKTGNVLSQKEYLGILSLCREMGVDYAELDVIRDRNTKKLYVVDVNNTPACTMFGLSRKEYKNALETMTESFLDSFRVTKTKSIATKLSFI